MLAASTGGHGVPDALCKQTAHHRRLGPEGALARDSAALAIVMGCWVLLTPWAFHGVDTSGAAFWSLVSAGSLICLTASAKAVFPLARVLSWVTLASGGWVMISFVVLSGPARPTANAAVVGLCIVLASLASIAGTTLANSVKRPQVKGAPRRHTTGSARRRHVAM